jgi:hypothetical protein
MCDKAKEIIRNNFVMDENMKKKCPLPPPPGAAKFQLVFFIEN